MSIRRFLSFGFKKRNFFLKLVDFYIDEAHLDLSTVSFDNFLKAASTGAEMV